MRPNRQSFNRSLRALSKRDRTFIKGGEPVGNHDAIRLKIVSNVGAAMLSASIARLSSKPIEAYPPALAR